MLLVPIIMGRSGSIFDCLLFWYSSGDRFYDSLGGCQVKLPPKCWIVERSVDIPSCWDSI